MIDIDDLEARIAENERHGLYTSPAVKALIAELREARGERAAVVAWLRECALDPDATGAEMRLLQEHATRIERGEHRREEER